jgi:Ca-activated chloride channel family protein
MNLTFAHPILLTLLVLPVALLIWTWKRESRRVALPFDHARGSNGRAWRFFINLAESLPALLLAIAIALIAGPQKQGPPRTKRVLTNIQFCVDISGSMTAPFGDGSRYDGAMAAITDFLDFRKGDAFGLTFFGNSVLHWVPLTNDVSAIRCAPPYMRPENAPPGFGGTEIGKALLACKEVLCEREEGDRMIILVSDGFSADLMNGNDQTVANTLKENNITVFHIHVAEGEVPPDIVNITAATGGAAFAVDDPDALKTVFQRIDQMKGAKLEKTAPETLDDFVPTCIAGLSILATLCLAALGLRYTPW